MRADLNVGHSSKILRDIKDPDILIIGYEYGLIAKKNIGKPTT